MEISREQLNIWINLQVKETEDEAKLACGYRCNCLEVGHHHHKEGWEDRIVELSQLGLVVDTKQDMEKVVGLTVSRQGVGRACTSESALINSTLGEVELFNEEYYTWLMCTAGKTIGEIVKDMKHMLQGKIEEKYDKREKGEFTEVEYSKAVREEVLQIVKKLTSLNLVVLG